MPEWKCKTCLSWRPVNDVLGMGKCAHGKMKYRVVVADLRLGERVDLCVPRTCEWDEAWVETGPDFGCVHWEMVVLIPTKEATP